MRLTSAACAGTLLATLLLAGCASSSKTSGTTAAPTKPSAKAIAALKPTQGNRVAGTVQFEQHEFHVTVNIQLTGLTPGEHGFHIHENGDCSAADGSSAGGHFNPLGAKHGNALQGQHHLGDMPNLVANSSGTVSTHFDIVGSLKAGDPDSLVGHAVIVHANPDDYRSQPAGNSGPRVACGVIAAAR